MSTFSPSFSANHAKCLSDGRPRDGDEQLQSDVLAVFTSKDGISFFACEAG
jgi:hypothetical protein